MTAKVVRTPPATDMAAPLPIEPSSATPTDTGDVSDSEDGGADAVSEDSRTTDEEIDKLVDTATVAKKAEEGSDICYNFV